MEPSDPSSRSAEIVQALRAQFEYTLTGYLHGKSVMRDFLVERYDVSELQAEETLDELEGTGQIRFEGDPTKASHRGAIWMFGPSQVYDVS